jgi:hypothetical protein
MYKDFLKADQTVKSSEKAKFEIKDNQKILKQDLLNKQYNIEERTNLIDLIKFYSEWLYAPVDEELENKLYFISADNGILNLYPELNEKFNSLNINERDNFQFGIRNKKITH